MRNIIGGQKLDMNMLEKMSVCLGLNNISPKGHIKLKLRSKQQLYTVKLLHTNCLHTMT